MNRKKLMRDSVDMDSCPLCIGHVPIYYCAEADVASTPSGEPHVSDDSCIVHAYCTIAQCMTMNTMNASGDDVSSKSLPLLAFTAWLVFSSGVDADVTDCRLGIGWIQGAVRVIYYEDLLEHPYQVLLDIQKFLGLELFPGMIDSKISTKKMNLRTVKGAIGNFPDVQQILKGSRYERMLET